MMNPLLKKITETLTGQRGVGVVSERDALLADREENRQYPVNARKRRRLAEADRRRQQRKGNRAYVAEQLERRRQYEGTLGQVKVLAAGETAPGNAARYQTVLHGLTRAGYDMDAVWAAVEKYKIELEDARVQVAAGASTDDF